MALDEDQLAVVLQASLAHAERRLSEHGGFLPFGAHVGLDGGIAVLEVDQADPGEAVDAIYVRIAAVLAEDARDGQILAAALVANADLPAGAAAGFERAISVLVETEGFCRAIVAPYRLAEGGVEFGEMIPEAADPLVYVG